MMGAGHVQRFKHLAALRWGGECGRGRLRVACGLIRRWRPRRLCKGRCDQAGGMNRNDSRSERVPRTNGFGLSPGRASDGSQGWSEAQPGWSEAQPLVPERRFRTRGLCRRAGTVPLATIRRPSRAQAKNNSARAANHLSARASLVVNTSRVRTPNKAKP